MASIRKRTWKTDGETHTAWAVDFVDQTGERHRRQFSTKREADAFRIEIENITSINTARGVRVTGKRNEGSQKITPPSKELIRALLDEASADFRPMLLLAVSTGVRAGEMWGLRWRHVDLIKRELRVEMRIDASGNEDDQGTKTAAGMRTIPLAEQLVAELRDWRARSRFSSDDDFVFPSVKGKCAESGQYDEAAILPTLRPTRQKACFRTAQISGTETVHLACAQTFRNFHMDRSQAVPKGVIITRLLTVAARQSSPRRDR